MAKKPTAAQAKALKAKRMKVINEAASRVEKLYGVGSAMLLRGGQSHVNLGLVGVISSGSLGLDEAIGIGGYPRGRIVEIYGAESSGKTTMALTAVANAQKLGLTSAYVDAEHALDPIYMENLGVDLEEMLLSQPDSGGEQALEIVETYVDTGVDIIVVDSVSALVPRAELEGDMGDHHPGAQARLMSQALRKLTAKVHKQGTLLIFINQTREKIGVKFGSPETTSGGKALKFYASLRIKVSRIGSLKKGEDVYANKTKADIKKNKVAPPFKKCEFDIIFGEGISLAGEILDIMLAKKVITKSGSWFKYKEESVGQGRAGALAWIKGTPGILEELQGLAVQAEEVPELVEEE